MSANNAPEVSDLLRMIEKGNFEQRQEAIAWFGLLKPAEAIDPLLKWAKGGIFSSDDRQAAAALALGEIGDPRTAEKLIKFSGLDDANACICYALYKLGNPVAIPYFTEKSTYGKLPARAYAVMGLAATGHPDAINPLVENAHVESTSHLDIFRAARHPPGDFSSRLLKHMAGDKNALGYTWSNQMASMFFAHQAAKDVVKKNANMLADADWELDMIMDAPGDVRLMWMIHLRLKSLITLVARCGLEPLFSNKQKYVFALQKLTFALTVLRFQPENREARAMIDDHARAKDYKARILACEGHIQLAGTVDTSQQILTALADPDSRVRSAVAATLANVYVALTITEEPIPPWLASLLPQALQLAGDPSVDTRSSMITPLGQLAIMGYGQAEAVLIQLSEKEPNKDIRQRVVETMVAVKQSQMAVVAEPSLLPSAAKGPVAAVAQVEQKQTADPLFQSCPECGHSLRLGARFCGECGKQVGAAAETVCPQCERPVRPQAKFCAGCGYHLV